MTEPTPAKGWRPVFDVVSTIAMIALAAVMVWEGRARSSGSPDARAASRIPIPSEPIAVDNSAVRGSATATVAIVEYADFECSFCARYAQSIEPALQKEYVDTGRVLLVYKHFPLSNHEFAPAAAQAAWCAGQQSKFWEMHHGLFGLSGRLKDFNAETLGKEIGLNMDAYNSCRSSPEAQAAVRSDRAEGERLQVSGTPAFFIGRIGPDRRVQVTEVISGAKAIESFKAALDRLF